MQITHQLNGKLEDHILQIGTQLRTLTAEISVHEHKNVAKC